MNLYGAQGLRLVADALGPPTGPPVLLCHGAGQTRHSWGATSRALGRRGWRAVAFDHRGHGDSEWAPDGDYRFETFAADLATIARGFSAPPVVIGASLGGVAGMLAAGEGLAQFAALILVDITPRMEERGVERVYAFMQAHAQTGFASLEEAAEAVAAYLPQRRRSVDLRGLRKNLRRSADGRWRWHWDPAFLAGKKPQEALAVRERLAAAVRQIDCPLLLVRGRLSDVVSEEAAREFRSLAPHARIADVSGTGHMVSGDDNDAFTRLIVEFLAQADGAPLRD